MRSVARFAVALVAAAALAGCPGGESAAPPAPPSAPPQPFPQLIIPSATAAPIAHPRDLGMTIPSGTAIPIGPLPTGTAIALPPSTSSAPAVPAVPAGSSLAPVTLTFPEIARLVPAPSGLATATVEKVVDGDTVWLAGGKKVRLVGVNTPERGDPLYEEATEFTRAVIGGRPVGYIHDKEARDQYKRELCYVFVEGRFLNGELVRRGLAYCYRWEPNTRYATELLSLQKAARADKLGLWGLAPPPPAPRYVSEARSHIFHRPDCPTATKIQDERRLAWESRFEAFDSGRNPCRDCKP